ncbi:exported hypothetical protein [Candidatus Sulfopaludibacter sp. SbA3]|nr:exported hypothetical protein [Candidatus Sulfopaludibacter sp. SbA3]
MTRFRYLWFCLAIPAAGFGQTGAAAFQARRQTAAEKAAGGIILLHANSGMKHWEEAGFHQDPNFYYFAGCATPKGRSSRLTAHPKKAGFSSGRKWAPIKTCRD